MCGIVHEIAQYRSNYDAAAFQQCLLCCADAP